MASFFIRRGVHNSRSRILRRHTSYSDIFAYTNAKKLKLGRGRFLSNVNNGPRLWVAAAGPGYHSGRHHHKVRPTFSNLRPPRKARKRPLLDHFFAAEKILISLQTGGWPQQHREACDRFLQVGFAANSKIKGERAVQWRLGNVVAA